MGEWSEERRFVNSAMAPSSSLREKSRGSTLEAKTPDCCTVHSIHRKRIEIPSVKLEVFPGFLSRNQAWKFQVSPASTL